MTMDKNFLILMVEDEVGVMEVNRRMLKRRGYELKEAKNAKEAYDFLEHHRPDLLILDIMLPDGNGYDICSYFRKQCDNPVIFLTGKVETEDKVKGLSRGCDYYLTKPYSFEELLAVVKRLLIRVSKEQDVHDHMTKTTIGNLTLDFSSYKAFVNEKDIGLTKTEFTLLKIFVENKNREISADELYLMVWEKPSGGDSRSIRKHVMNLRNKICADDSEYYDILTAYGKGYTFIVC